MYTHLCEILHSIYQNPGQPRPQSHSEQIQGEQLKGGTSGEMFNFVLSELISIKDHRPEVYTLIKEETEWMITYAKTIGYR